jgi:AcrR family transcriptional regulator
MARTERGRQTRALILERAAAVFDRQGFAASTLSDLVANSGLTRGAFYFHFESKDALAAAIAEAQAERWRAQLAEVTREVSDPLRRLVTLGMAAAKAHATDPVARAAGRLLAERALIRRELPPTAPWWMDTLEQLLSEADTAGQLRDLSRLVRPEKPATPERVHRTAAEYVLAGWSALSAAAADGADLADRLYAHYAVVLPTLCADPEHADRLLSLVAETAEQMEG